MENSEIQYPFFYINQKKERVKVQFEGVYFMNGSKRFMSTIERLFLIESNLLTGESQHTNRNVKEFRTMYKNRVR